MSAVQSSVTQFEGGSLDIVEAIIEANEWPFDRSSGELIVSVSGSWCDYHLCFSEAADLGALHVSCAPDLRVPEERYGDLYELTGRMNERMLFGHFELVSDEGVPLYRVTQILPEGTRRACQVAERLIEAALTQSERFYPAVQLMLWAGHTPESALDAVLMEPVGHC